MSLDLEKAGAKRPIAERRGYKLIDSDVHIYSNGYAAILPYMPQAWRERFVAKGVTITSTLTSWRYANPNGGRRSDAVPPDGGPEGSDPAFLVKQLVEGWGIDVAILNGIQPAALAAGLAGPDESIVLCRAYNDYFLQEFVRTDSRLRWVVCVTPQDPLAAAEEIIRLGGDSQVVGVHLPLVNTLIGNRFFDPIYRAAQDQNLPIFMHVGPDFVYLGLPVPAGGIPESATERRCCFNQIAESNTANLVFSGTLERFPSLNFVFVEYGFTWVAPLLWRMDSTWKSSRIEVPWVKKWPSEYVHERIRFTTQPLDEPRELKDLDLMIEMLGDDMLMFATDYPHYDTDNPDRVLQSLPKETRERIYWSNPSAFWRL